MGYKIENSHYYLVCDKCGIKKDLKTVLDLNSYKNANGWFTLFNNYYLTLENDWTTKEFCNSCAKALNYI